MPYIAEKYYSTLSHCHNYHAKIMYSLVIAVFKRNVVHRFFHSNIFTRWLSRGNADVYSAFAVPVRIISSICMVFNHAVPIIIIRQIWISMLPNIFTREIARVSIRTASLVARIFSMFVHFRVIFSLLVPPSILLISVEIPFATVFHRLVRSYRAGSLLPFLLVCQLLNFFDVVVVECALLRFFRSISLFVGVNVPVEIHQAAAPR